MRNTQHAPKRNTPVRATVAVSITVVLAALLAVAAVAALTGPGDLPPSPEAEALVQARRYGEALTTYERLAARYPRDPEPYFRISAIRRAQKLPARAVEAALLGLARDPQNPGGLRLLGNLYTDQGLLTLSVEKYQASLAVDPAQADVRVALGRVLIRQGQLDAAQAQMALALNPDPSGLANPKGLYEAHFYLALLLAPRDPTAAGSHLAVAAADPGFAARAGDFQATLGLIEVARQTGGDAYALTTLGAGYLQAGEPALALPTLQTAVNLAPRYADAHAYLGYTHWLLGDPRSALAELDTAIAQDANFAEAHHWRGLALRSLARSDEAIAALQRALAIQPADPEVYADLGATYEAQRDYAAAEESLQKAVQVDPNSGPLALRLARFYVEHGLKVRDAGRPAATRATELLPRDGEAWELLGWAYYLSGEASAARSALERAVSLDVDRPSAHYRLGVVLRDLGDAAGARRGFQMAMDLQPEGPWAARARQEAEGQ
jgi:tetratricopeptide (TPR) repeat protein